MFINSQPSQKGKEDVFPLNIRCSITVLQRGEAMRPAKPNGWHPNGVESSDYQNLLEGVDWLANKNGATGGKDAVIFHRKRWTLDTVDTRSGGKNTP